MLHVLLHNVFTIVYHVKQKYFQVKVQKQQIVDNLRVLFQVNYSFSQIKLQLKLYTIHKLQHNLLENVSPPQ